MAEENNDRQVGSRDKSVPWFIPKLDDIPGPARELLEGYSHIPTDRVSAHVHEVRDRAWDIWPYPCIGMFHFLDLGISTSPVYDEVLRRAKAGGTVLDLGCCFGQDIRKLVFDGVPAENIWGADLRHDFLQVGFELFKDKDSLKSNFVVADIFNPDSDLKQLDGKIDIIHVGSFIHLFDWDGQMMVCKRLVQLLRPQKGSLILGRQVGNKQPGTYPHRTNPKGTMFRHDEKTFEDLWKQVGNETGSRWLVDAMLKDAAGFVGPSKDGDWADPNLRRLVFAVRRE